jgi:hypothetical protein
LLSVWQAAQLGDFKRMPSCTLDNADIVREGILRQLANFVVIAEELQSQGAGRRSDVTSMNRGK